jgi:preprotein translocase subunit SecG
MSTFVLAVQIALVVVSVLMIVIVLAQKTKSAGIGSAYGSETQSFTTRGKAARTEAKLQKTTIIFGIIFAVLSLSLLVIGNLAK